MKKIFILSLSLILFSCGNDESDLLKDRIEEVQNTERTFDGSPCELLSVDELRGICSVGDEFEIKQEAKKYTFPTCSYVWNDGKRTNTIVFSGIKRELPLENQVMIVMVKNASDDMFETSSKVYKDGISVDGVGKKAKWGEKMSQLSFLAKGYMFHVNVKAFRESSENKESAIKISQYLIDKL